MWLSHSPIRIAPADSPGIVRHRQQPESWEYFHSLFWRAACRYGTSKTSLPTRAAAFCSRARRSPNSGSASGKTTRFASRDLGEYEVVYLFIDGIAERIRPGSRREPVLAAWGFTANGAKVLLHLMAGSKEDAETVSAFFHDMRARGLGDPLLVVSDGVPGIIKAIETCFPRSERQRCLAHRMRNLAAKAPEDIWPEFKARATASYQAPSRAIARELAEGLARDYESELPGAVACFRDDFEACIAHLRVPINHRRAVRTTNLLERLFVEERRRMKIIAGAIGEKAVLKLMFAAMLRASERWRALKVTGFELRQMDALRRELDQNYKEDNDIRQPSADVRQKKLSSIYRT